MNKIHYNDFVQDCHFFTSFITGNTKEGSTTVPLTSCLTGLDWSVLQIKIKLLVFHTANFKLVKQEVNGTVILPPIEFRFGLGWFSF